MYAVNYLIARAKITNENTSVNCVITQVADFFYSFIAKTYPE